jgi:hypothetical protein
MAQLFMGAFRRPKLFRFRAKGCETFIHKLWGVDQLHTLSNESFQAVKNVGMRLHDVISGTMPFSQKDGDLLYFA